MKLQKIAALVMAGIMSVGFVSGCGNSEGTAVSKDQAAASDTTQGETKTQGGEGASGKQKIELWHYFNETSQSSLNQVIEAYNSSQDQYEVAATFISRNDLMKQYTLGAVSGELPDMGMVDNPDMASYISLGVFADITDYANQWGELSKFYESPISTCYQDGKLYGLPSNTNSIAMYYNKTMFQDAGLTDADVPTTWDELYEVSKKLKKDDVYGFSMCAKGSEEGTFNFIPWFSSAGASVSDLDSPEAIKTMQFLRKLIEEGLMSEEVVNWGQSDVMNAFIAEKVAIVQNGSWYIPQLDEANPNFEWGVALLPKDQKTSSCIGGENIGICTGGNMEGAWDFLSYFMSAQANADFCEGAAKFPVRSDAMALKPIWSEDERYQVFSKALESAQARGPEIQWPTISEAIYTSAQAILLGEIPVEAALAEAAAKADAALAD